MHQALTRHPDSRCTAVTGIDVSALRLPNDMLVLRYVVHGAMAGLRLPAPAATLRTNDLWRHTCFEAFVRGQDTSAYGEINLAPSTQWALYAFDGYRAGMRDARMPAPPQITFESRNAETCELRAVLSLTALNLGAAPWRLGLSAVIEETDGAVSYWAAAHPPGKPDFHHADGFAITLPEQT